MSRKPGNTNGGANRIDEEEAQDGSSSGRHLKSNPVTEEIRRMMAGQSFATLEEAQAVMDRIATRYNRTPNADFEGLSPEQMTSVLHYPFDSPHIAEFAQIPASAHTAPISRLFELLYTALGEAGVKPTATGNLPLSIVRPIALQYWGDELHAEMTRFGALRSETEFGDLFALRMTAQMERLLRRYKGKLGLTRACRDSLSKHGIEAIYPALLRAYACEFNWPYRDRCPELDIIQGSFLFSLLLLHRYGDTWRENSFYEDAFIRAFPAALEQIAPSPYTTPERTLRRFYSLRCLERFAAFFGLIETEKMSDDIFDSRFRLRKLPLLDEAVIFHI